MLDVQRDAVAEHDHQQDRPEHGERQAHGVVAAARSPRAARRPRRGPRLNLLGALVGMRRGEPLAVSGLGRASAAAVAPAFSAASSR